MMTERIYTRRLSVLLGVSLFNWTAGNGLFPLLSLYALERGATVEITGMLLAAGFVSLAVGSITAATLTRIVGSHRWAYVGAALLQTCAYALMGRVTELWQLLALLACADPQAIAATTAIGGLVTAPLVPLIGALSDRLGRRPVLVGTYGLIAVASGVLSCANHYWQFSLAAALLSLGFAVGSSVSAALAGDLVAAAALPHTIGRLSTATWIGAVLAFGGGGALLGSIAVPTLCLFAVLLAVSASLTASCLRTTPAVSVEFPVHTGVNHGRAD